MCNFEKNDLDLYLLIWRYFQLIMRSKVCMIQSQVLVKKKVITNENLLCSSEKSTQCSVGPKWEGNPKTWGYMYTCIHI